MMEVMLIPPHPLSDTTATLVSTRHSATPVYLLKLGPCRGSEGQWLEGCVLPVYRASFVIVEESEES